MNPSESVRPNEPATADEKDQDADVGSDRVVDSNPAKKPPLDINEIEALEGDVEGG